MRRSLRRWDQFFGNGLNINNPDIVECITKALAKFDGNRLVPPEPEKGCFEKLEGKQDITDPAVEKPRAMFSPPGSFHPVRRMRVIQLVPFAEVWLK